MNTNYPHTFSFIFVIILFFSCKKDTPTNYTEGDRSIHLQVEKLGTEHKFTWTTTNNSSYNWYTIVMLDKPISNNYLDTASQFEYNSFYIDDQRKENLITLLVPNADTMYYRLFAKIGNRTIVSNEVKVGFENITTINQLTDFLFDNKSNTFIYQKYTSGSFDSIISINYKENIISGNHFFGYHFSRGTIGDNGFGPELYTPSLELHNITVFRIPNLDYAGEIQLAGLTEFTKTATNNNGHVAILRTILNQIDKQNLQIIERSTNNLIYEEEISLNVYSSNFNLSFFPNTPNKLLLLKDDGMTLYHFEQNELVDRIDTDAVYNSKEIVFSPDNQHFILGASNSNYSYLYLYSSNLELLASHEMNYTDAAFSTDGSKIYVIVNNGISLNNKTLAIHSFPDLQLEKEIPLPFSVERILINENKLMLFGHKMFQNDHFFISVVEI